MNTLQALVLGFVQGVTEFLPISSDGHLNLVQHLFGLTPSLSFDVFLHMATFLSVLFFFRKKIKYFISNLPFIVIGTIPAVIIGFFFKDQVSILFASPKLLPLFFLFTSIYTLSTKFIKKQDKKITYLSALIIGIFQAIALLPGVSRSGGTIFAGLLLGLSPLSAFNFSFSLFVPISAGAILLEAKDIAAANLINPLNIIAFIFTFFVGLAALKLLEKILSGNKFWVFGIYTVLLALVLFFTL